MDRIISPGVRLLVVQRVNGYDRRAFYATVIEWTSKGRLKVKKAVDDRIVTVSPKDVKILADGKVIDVSLVPSPDSGSRAVILYLPPI